MVLLLTLVLGPLLVVAGYYTRPQCPGCARRTLHYLHQTRSGNADERFPFNPRLCSACGWATSLPIEKRQPSRLSGRTVPPIAAEPGDDAGIIYELIRGISAQAGPVGRREALDAGLLRLSTETARQRLRLEASRAEVAAVLGNVGTLKTNGAKRRRLEQAIEELHTTHGDDSRQQELITVLRRALAKLGR